MSTVRTLIRGATVITLDALGHLPRADVLVTGDRITDMLTIHACARWWTLRAAS